MNISDLLLKWTTAEQVPAEVIPHLEKVRDYAFNAIQPAQREAWAIIMDEFIGWIERFGIVPLDPPNSNERKAWVGALVGDYRKSLHDLPDDLLIEAFRKTIAVHSYRNLPLPGEVRKRVESELNERRLRFYKINTASDMLKYRPHVETTPENRGPRTPEEIEMVSKLAAEARAHLKKVG